MAQTMKDILNRMLNHEELSREEMKNILIGITQSEYPTEQITALLTALQMRGVTVDELLGFRDGILETGVPAILNAANEIAFERFRAGTIHFTDIWRIVKRTMAALGRCGDETLDAVLEADARAREYARGLVLS